MLVVGNLNYDSWQTVYFQRASVIVTEFVLVFALNRYSCPSFFVACWKLGLIKCGPQIH